MLWVLQKDVCRSYDFTNPAQVNEAEVANDKVPKPIMDALRGANVPGNTKPGTER